MKKQVAETVPIGQTNDRIRDLNREGYQVLSLSVDREKDQMWLLVQK